MKFGVLKDIKNGEFRVIATPTEVHTLAADGNEVYFCSGAGRKAGFEDEDYAKAGGVILETNEEIWATCDFVAKVKEIEESEYDLLREGQIIYTCIHPAAHKAEVDNLLKKKVIAFTAEDSHRYGSPNCEAAGKAGAFMGLWAMMSNNGGSGKFASGLAGAPGVRAIVCGAGIVGKAAIEVLVNMGCQVTVADINVGILRDISNDYGCIETFHETTHEDPIYIEEDVVHYCVSNIPGAIAGSTSVSYAASVLPHFRNIINNGVAGACARDGFLRRSLTAYKGYLTHEETSGIQDRPWIPPEKILDIEDQPLDPAPKTTVTRSENYYTEIDL